MIFVSLLRFFFFLILLYFLFDKWLKMHAVFKISMDSYTNLMEFSFFHFFFYFLLFLPLPNMILLAFLTPTEYWADIFT